MNPLSTHTVKTLQENLLCHTLHLHEHVLHLYLSLVHLEIMLLRKNVISAQNMNLRLLPHSPKRFTVLLIYFTDVVLRVFTWRLSLQRMALILLNFLTSFRFFKLSGCFFKSKILTARVRDNLHVIGERHRTFLQPHAFGFLVDLVMNIRSVTTERGEPGNHVLLDFVIPPQQPLKQRRRLLYLLEHFLDEETITYSIWLRYILFCSNSNNKY